MLHQDAAIHADRHSLAAGRDINLTITADELQSRLARYADDPHAMHCAWCGLRGQPPSTDHCLLCGCDIGVERRAREAAFDRRRRVLRRLGNLRSLLCYLLAGVVMYLVLLWQGTENPGAVGVLTGGTIFILALGQMFVWTSIGLGIWLRFTLPRLLQQQGLSWFKGSY